MFISIFSGKPEVLNHFGYQTFIQLFQMADNIHANALGKPLPSCCRDQEQKTCPMEYAYGFVVLCFVLFISWFTQTIDLFYIWLFHRAVKLPWIFLGAPLIFNGAPGNIKGNFDFTGTGTISLSMCPFASEITLKNIGQKLMWLLHKL